MGTRRPQYLAAFSILLVLFVSVEVTTAQITFNRQWRRGNYPWGELVDGVEIGGLVISPIADAEYSQSTIAQFANIPSIILSGKVFGEIWKGSKNLPQAPTKMPPQIRQVPIHWKVIRTNWPLDLPRT